MPLTTSGKSWHIIKKKKAKFGGNCFVAKVFYYCYFIFLNCWPINWSSGSIQLKRIMGANFHWVGALLQTHPVCYVEILGMFNTLSLEEAHHSCFPQVIVGPLRERISSICWMRDTYSYYVISETVEMLSFSYAVIIEFSLIHVSCLVF